LLHTGRDGEQVGVALRVDAGVDRAGPVAAEHLLDSGVDIDRLAGLFGASFQTLAIQIAVERDKGILKRLEGTPMPAASYFIGKIFMVLVTVVLEIVILLGISVALGKVSLPTDWHRWVTMVWVTLLGVTAGSILGIAFSSLARSGKAAPAW
jgi:ABC-2 type transport system permease protein